MRCKCTYNQLIKKGFHPPDHAVTCPLSKIYQESELATKRFIPPQGNNPYGKVNRANDINPYAKQETKTTIL